MASFPDAATSAANLWSAQQIAVEVEGPDGGRLDLLVDKPFARVGRDQRAEVPLSEGSLLPCHLYLHATDEGVYYVGLSANAPSGWLLPSESVQVGPFELRAHLAKGKHSGPLPMDLQAKQNGLSPVPQLRVFSGSSPARSADLRLRRRLTLLGRQSPATRRVNHPSISRVHCAVFWNGRELWLVDFFSSNGTRLAGQKFDSGRIAVGQEFRLGSARFHYLGTQSIDAAEADGSALEQPVGILDHSDESAPHDSESRLTAPKERDPSFARFEATLEEIQQQLARLEQERQQVQRPTGEAGVAGSADDEPVRVAEALASAEARWTELVQELSRRTLDLERQIAASREDLDLVAGSMKREHEAMQWRLRKERRTYRKRLAAAKREFVAKMASLQEYSQAVRQDLQSLQGDMDRTQPTSAGEEAERSESAAGPLAETVKRHDEILLMAEARWKNFAEGFERRASEVAQQIADCRRADAQFAEGLQGALRATSQLQSQQQALVTEAGAVKDELLAGTAALREQVKSLPRDLETQTADLAPLKQTLTDLQPTLARLESGEWLADLERRWQAHLQAAINEVHQRIADLQRQSSLDRNADRDRLAILDNELQAKMADLRSGHELLRGATAQERLELQANLAVGEQPRDETQRRPGIGPPSSTRFRREMMADGDLRPVPGQPLDAENAVLPEWVINDEVTQRLVNFKTNRQQIAGRRRLLWCALATGIVVIVVSGAGIVQLWLRGSDATASEEAAPLLQSRLTTP